MSVMVGAVIVEMAVTGDGALMRSEKADKADTTKVLAAPHPPTEQVATKVPLAAMLEMAVTGDGRLMRSGRAGQADTTEVLAAPHPPTEQVAPKVPLAAMLEAWR